MWRSYKGVCVFVSDSNGGPVKGSGKLERKSSG